MSFSDKVFNCAYNLIYNEITNEDGLHIKPSSSSNSSYSR